MRLYPRSALLLCLVLALPTSALAQWKFAGTPLAYTAPNSQNKIVVCPDGAGGAIMAWEDTRNDPGNLVSDIYAQRINSSGVVQWGTNGVAVCTAANSQSTPRIVSDNAGGAIIAWADWRYGNVTSIYAQRLNASGVAQWIGNGVAITTQGGTSPTLIADASGGAIVTWTDWRNLNNQDIYAQRLSNAGVSQWIGSGVAVCAATGNQGSPVISTDGSTGAIIAWEDARSSGLSVYAQKVNASGAMQWTANGVFIGSNSLESPHPSLVVDGAGNTIITWIARQSADANIFAQRLNSAGAAQWAASGVDVCTATGDQGLPLIVSDGSQGAIIMFADQRNGNGDIYAQRIGISGNRIWGTNGVPVTTDPGEQNFPQVVSDGAGGVNVIWMDFRNSFAMPYAQHLDGSGTQLLTADGVQMSSQVATEPMVTSDGAGNIIAACNTGTGGHVYAQRMEMRYGYWGKPEPALFAAKDVPADQGGKVRLEWYASGYDVIGQSAITYYTIWRAIDQAAFAAASAAGVPVVKENDVSPGYKGAAIRRQKIQTTDYFWTLVGTQNAFRRYAYAFDASTSFDSTAANPATNRFQVLSHAGSDLINFPSNVLAGRSVDNLAPPAPLFLTAQRTGNYVYLKWNGVHVPDLDKYTVYRATSTGVTAIPANFLANDKDTLLTDSSAPSTALYYIVTATDIHQNQGVKSNEAAVGSATGVGNTPAITALAVLQNQPNPFGDQTQLRVGLPSRSDVHVEVYDVAGRRLRNVLVPAQEKGWNTLRISARDDRGAALPSGVYFYRVRAGAETVTKKMVIAR